MSATQGAMSALLPCMLALCGGKASEHCWRGRGLLATRHNQLPFNAAAASHTLLPSDGEPVLGKLLYAAACCWCRMRAGTLAGAEL